MYSARSGLILGFHGCDASLVPQLLDGSTKLKDSTNKYDWLGHGVYAWDNSPSRAMEFAEFLRDHPGKSKSPITNPAVIGVILNLGFCLDLLDYENLRMVQEAHKLLCITTANSNITIPINKPARGNKDLIFRELDCAVIESLHQFRKNEKMRAFDSVRGMFSEGKELYENAGFKEKDHIQICIRNPNCIKGYFNPLKETNRHPLV
jgi:hypothetical protein